ncbi:hypothetical protein D4R86_01460 [bacterium]|nr:MAG: hypothetical protein D4R86_01460 [bacterium]
MRNRETLNKIDSGELHEEKDSVAKENITEQKETSDMEQLSKIEEKHNRGEELSKEELCFLYEIDRPPIEFPDDHIEAKQARKLIKDIMIDRDIKQDYATIFECSRKEVNYTGFMITDDTVVCLGSIGSYFFEVEDKMPPNLKHVTGDVYAWHHEMRAFGFPGIKSLRQIESIGESADFTNSEIEDLGELRSIGKDARFSYSRIKSLAKIETIYGDLDLRKSKVKDLGNLRYVGGTIYVDKDSPLDFSNIEHGEIVRK